MAAARLGARVTLLARLGSDEHGEALLAQLTREGALAAKGAERELGRYRRPGSGRWHRPSFSWMRSCRWPRSVAAA